MSTFLDKIKSFFKRSREESESLDRTNGAKRARYMSTPATTKFSPNQVRFKRVKRQHYILDELLDATEDRNYEFKAGGMLLQKHSLMPMIQKYGSAFLNSEGGVLIGGVDNSGQVTGIPCSIRKEIEIEDTIRSEFEKFRPFVSKDFYRVEFLPVKRGSYTTLENIKVVEIHIYKGDDSHLYETSKHEVYIRRDGGVQGPLRPLAIKDVVEQKYQKVLQKRQEQEKVSRALEKEAQLKSLKKDDEKENETSSESCDQNEKRKRVTEERPVARGDEGTLGDDRDAKRRYVSDRHERWDSNDHICEEERVRKAERKVSFIDLTKSDGLKTAQPRSVAFLVNEPSNIQQPNFSTAKRFFKDVRRVFSRK